jgi:glycosyltransferase involved in cell wall biosynthesis
MNDCSVSVVIITHDRDASFINRAVNCVISQRLIPKEIIIVDSGDEEHYKTTEITLSNTDFKGMDYSLVWLKNARAPEARNIGASRAKGDYLSFLDDDDEWYEHKLQSQISAINNDEPLVNIRYWEEYANESHLFGTKVDSFGSILGFNSLGNTSFPMIKKELFMELGGFDETFEANQEWDLWIRALKNNTAAFSNDIGGIKHLNPGISMNKKSRMSGWKSLFKKHRLEYLQHKDSLEQAMKSFRDDMYARRYWWGLTVAFYYLLRFRMDYFVHRKQFQ